MSGGFKDVGEFMGALFKKSREKDSTPVLGCSGFRGR